MKPEEPPFPGPLQASLLALIGLFLANLVAMALGQLTSPTTAIGFATVLGLGAAGALGAAHVPPPHGERLGLRGLRGEYVVPLLLLVPVALLATELGRLVASVLPAPDAPELVERVREALPTTGGPLPLLETAIVALGLTPLVEEWLFRGVIQQGLVARMGAAAGVVTTALLFALGHGGAGATMSPQSWLAIVAQVFALGLAFGFVRQATGSLLAPIALHAGSNALGLAALALAPRLPIPGFGTEGAHLPLPLLAAAALSTTLGVRLLSRKGPSRKGPGSSVNFSGPAGGS